MFGQQFPVDSIGIIGGGVVGKAIARTYADYVDVHMFDIIKQRCTWNNEENRDCCMEDVLQCPIIFVCLPTPPKGENSGVDPDSVLSTFEIIKRFDGNSTNKHYVIKSTLPIGTTRKIRDTGFKYLCHSPEFLTARTALIDSVTMTRHVIGIPGDDPKTEDLTKRRTSGHLYAPLIAARFPGASLVFTSSDESEAVKLMINSFFATKVAIFNEFKLLSDTLNLNWSKLLSIILTDGRITPFHTRVPGPDGKHGFGGACLPKDLGQMIEEMYLAKIDQYISPANWVCSSALARNCFDREWKPHG